MNDGRSIESEAWHGDPGRGGESASGGLPGDETAGPWGDWEEPEPAVGQDEFWDAFELDDEREEPEPEAGDFWLEPDEEAI